jgi:small subunit ribosomal protein S8
MTMNDLMSDFVARVNNAALASKTEVIVLKNNLIINVCKKLTALHIFQGFEVEENRVVIQLNLGRLHKIKRLSKPGQRMYTSYKNLPKIIGGEGYNILSTSNGVLSNVEAIKNKAGGELLFQVY